MRPVSRRASLRESAQRLLDPLIEGPDAEPLRPLLERCQEWLLSVGLTSITDIDGEDARAAYLAMQEDGTLRLRVTKCVRDGDLELAVSEGRRSGQGDDRFRVGPVKFFSDGALGSHTAHMTEPYVGSMAGHETCGIAVTPYPVLLQRVRMSLEAGLDVITHAIGDEANRLVLDAFQVMREEGHDGLLRIEHAQHVRPVDIPRFRSLDVAASMQPSHCTADLELADDIVGPRRLASYAWRSFLDAGVRVASGPTRRSRTPIPSTGCTLRSPVGGRTAIRSAAGIRRSGSRSTRPCMPTPWWRTSRSGATTSVDSARVSSPTSSASTVTSGSSRALTR